MINCQMCGMQAECIDESHKTRLNQLFLDCKFSYFPIAMQILKNPKNPIEKLNCEHNRLKMCMAYVTKMNLL